MSFKKFKRSAIAEMREVEAFEIDMFHERGALYFFEDSDGENKHPLKISISDEDLAAGSPKEGDMIARNPDNHRDQWLVANAYFKKNFERVIVLTDGESKEDRAYTPSIVDMNSTGEVGISNETLQKCMKKIPTISSVYHMPGYFSGSIQIENGHVVGIVFPQKREDELTSANWNCAGVINTSGSSFNSELKGEGFDFGHAIAAAKAGKKVARKGWNGSGMFAYIVPANQYPAQTELARKEFGVLVPYREYWALKTAQGDVATWAPSGSDSLAEDWMIID